MRETEEDLDDLQELLDESYAGQGPHMSEIITVGRRLFARDLTERLDGMCLLTLATATADGRPLAGPVDGVFYRGRWHFGSSPDSVRFRHIRSRPAVSATYLPSEEISVTVHGTADEIDITTDEHAEFREVMTGIYGTGWAEWAADSAYARIEPHKMFTFYLSPEARAAWEADPEGAARAENEAAEADAQPD